MAKFGPKMSEIAKFVDNGNKFALPVKALFTGKLGKPVLPVFTNFYRYKFTTLLLPPESFKTDGCCCWSASLMLGRLVKCNRRLREGTRGRLEGKWPLNPWIF